MLHNPTQNLGFQLTLFQLEGGADNAHSITACPPRFEKLTASLRLNPNWHELQKQPRGIFLVIKKNPSPVHVIALHDENLNDL